MSLDKYKVQNNGTEEEIEIVNYYNDNYEKIGTISRKEGIKQNLLLEAVQLWIINPHTKQVLMQKRSHNKVNDASMVDVSSSGHVKSTETPIQAILRETFEEISLKPEELAQQLQKMMIVECDFAKLGRKGRYFTHEYVAYLEYPLSYYTKQNEEVDKLFFMNYEELKEKIRNKEQNIRIPHTKETDELLYKIDESLYNYEKNKGKRGELECEEK